MINEPIHVTDANFEQAVMQSPLPVVVDFRGASRTPPPTRDDGASRTPPPTSCCGFFHSPFIEALDDQQGKQYQWILVSLPTTT